MDSLTADFLVQRMTTFGLTMPPDAQDALDTLAAVRAASVVVPEDLLAEEIAAGQVTVKNAAKKLTEHAARMVASAQLAPAARHFERPLLEHFKAALLPDVEDLIEDLRPVFDQHAAVVMANASKVDPLATSADNALHGSELLLASEQIDSASRALDGIRALWLDLERVRGRMPDALSAARWIESAPDAKALARADQIVRGRTGCWHRLAAWGFVLAFNDDDEAEAVIWQAQTASEGQQRNGNRVIALT